MPPAHAEIVTLDFDPPTFHDGQVLGWVGDIGFFGNATVFRPASVPTRTPPLALHMPAWCESSACANGASQMSILLRRRASAVTVRVGSDLVPFANFFCFPEGIDCGVYARLVARDGRDVIVDSRDVKLFDASTFQAPITTELSVADPHGRISGVTLVVGQGTFSHDQGNPGRVQIDHLVVTFVDGGSTEPPDQLPPSVTILTPVERLSYPYRFTATGTWTAPAGLLALCVRVNEPIPVDNRFCRNDAVLDDGTFRAELFRDSLLPSGNVLNVAVVDLAGRRGTASLALDVAAPPPPLIGLFTPRPGVWSPGGSPPFTASGITFVSGPPAGFCLRVARAVDTVLPPALADCQDQHALSPGGGFAGVPITAALLPPGEDAVHAYVFDAWGQHGETVVKGTVPANLRITGVEVTQGSQTYDAPFASGPYVGTALVKGVSTVARVFANAVAGGPFPGVNATLEGFRPSSRLGEEPLGLILPDNGARTLKANGALLLDERADPNGAYVFTLPLAWTQQGPLHLRATVNNPAFGRHVAECATCGGDNVVDITQIAFKDPLVQQVISPVAIRWTDSAGVAQDPPPSDQVFADFAALAPLPASRLIVRPYVAVLDGSAASLANGVATDGSCDQACRDALFWLTANFEIRNQPGFTIGISSAGVRGVTAPVTYVRFPTFFAWELVAIGSTTYGTEPLKLGIAHEMLHQFGFWHAGAACGAEDQPSTTWPPDFRGRLQGVGLDRRPGSGPVPGTYAVVVDRAVPDDAYDVMSYCAVGMPNWLSPRNWDAFGNVLTFSSFCLSGPCGAESAPPNARDSTRVMAQQSEVGAWTVVDVRRSRMPVNDAVVAATPLRFVARDQAGVVLVRVPAIAAQGFEAGRSRIAAADLPVTGVASVAIELDGVEVARRTASAHAPTIVLAEPVQLAPVPSTGELWLAWQADDTDGDALKVRVELAVDDGVFRPIALTGSRTGTSLPARLFSASDAARLRLVASDGFNETETISAPFTTPGAPPTLAVTAPAQDLRMLSTGTLNLAAQAFDDRGAPLDPAGVRWTLDGQPLGTGLNAVLSRPVPGRHVVAVTAADRLQRAGSAQRTIDVADGGIRPLDDSDHDWRRWLWLLLLALIAAM